MKRIITLTLSLLLSSLSLTAQSATVVIDNYQVAGINRLDVNGEFWDVRFHDGSYHSVFPSDDNMLSSPGGWGNSALLVYLRDEHSDWLGNASIIIGCSNNLCEIATPLFRIDPAFIQVTSVGIGTSYYGQFSQQYHTASANTSYHNLTYASWSMSPVPIPATAWLFGSALAGLLVARRNK